MLKARSLFGARRGAQLIFLTSANFLDEELARGHSQTHLKSASRKQRLYEEEIRSSLLSVGGQERRHLLPKAKYRASPEEEPPTPVFLRSSSFNKTRHVSVNACFVGVSHWRQNAEGFDLTEAAVLELLKKFFVGLHEDPNVMDSACSHGKSVQANPHGPHSRQLRVRSIFGAEYVFIVTKCACNHLRFQ